MQHRPDFIVWLFLNMCGSPKWHVLQFLVCWWSIGHILLMKNLIWWFGSSMNWFYGQIDHKRASLVLVAMIPILIWSYWKLVQPWRNSWKSCLMSSCVAVQKWHFLQFLVCWCNIGHILFSAQYFANPSSSCLHFIIHYGQLTLRFDRVHHHNFGLSFADC